MLKNTLKPRPEASQGASYFFLTGNGVVRGLIGKKSRDAQKHRKDGRKR